MNSHRFSFLGAIALLIASIAHAGPAAAQSTDNAQHAAQLPPDGARLMYTTYFYTAAEAVVHGYEPDTEVRILSMANGETIWSGNVGPGDTVLVGTGQGVFGFLSDKKAAILVGTPSSCTVVGYWVRDENGAFRSDHFYASLPASTNSGDERVIVWAWEDTDVTVVDLSDNTTTFSERLPAYGRIEIPSGVLASMGSHVLEIRAEHPVIEVQVYYDEGFTVPGSDGRAAGTDFLTYVGNITEGVNDLNLISYHAEANVTVEDIDSREMIWSGVVSAGGVHTLTMAERHVRVRSDAEISVMVAPYEHYTTDYAEHHFSMGAEGTGIENHFMLPTPNELWIFSYFGANLVTVEDIRSGQQVWSGVLEAGNVQGLYPGHGFYRVRSSRGISVMGGSNACGAEYSPAAGLFRVDETLLAVLTDIRNDRIQAAAQDGRELSAEELAAPLTADEIDRAVRRVQTATGNSGYDASQVQERLDDMQFQQ